MGYRRPLPRPHQGLSWPKVSPLIFSPCSSSLTYLKLLFPTPWAPVLPVLMDPTRPADFHGDTGVSAQRSSTGPEPDALAQQLLTSAFFCLILNTWVFPLHATQHLCLDFNWKKPTQQTKNHTNKQKNPTYMFKGTQMPCCTKAIKHLLNLKHIHKSQD